MKRFAVIHNFIREREKMCGSTGRCSGFSMLEVLLSIVIFAVLSTSIGSSLVLAHRINAKSDELMQEQLLVSRTVETLMAEGIITEADGQVHNYAADPRFVGVTITAVHDRHFDADPASECAAFHVTVTSVKDSNVTVDTYIRPKDGNVSGDAGDADPDGEGGGGAA